MEAEIAVADVQTFETKGGNTRYVVRADDGSEYTTFREAIGSAALAAQGKRARIEYHEQQRGQYTNVYLDSIEPLAGQPGGQLLHQAVSSCRPIPFRDSGRRHHLVCRFH